MWVMRIGCLLALAAVMLAVVPTASALTPTQIGKCLDLSGTSALPISKMTADLGIPRDQAKEAQARLTNYQRDPSAFPAALDGFGLTPHQITEIMRRVAVWIRANTREVGAPCPPFKNRQKVIARVKALLIYNGFRPAMRFSNASSRQITLSAVRDGFEMRGVVVKIAPRKIFLSITSATRNSGGSGGSLTVPLTFEA